MVEEMVNRFSAPQGWSRLVRVALAGFLSACLLVQDARAELQGCPNEAAPNDKLLIGSMDPVGTINEQIRRTLLAAFEMHFDQVDASLGSFAKVIYCPRRPMREPNTYDASVTGVLNDERVLLEVGARFSGNDIMVAYVVVPLRHYEFHNARPPRMPGYHEALYEQTRIQAGLAELFRGNAELHLLAALALGLRHEKAADAAIPPDEQKTMLERSRAFYCDAIGTLDAARPRADFFGLQQAEWKTLGDYAHDGAERVYQRSINEFGVQSTLPVLREIRGDGASDSGACVDPLPEPTGEGGDQ